MGACFEVYKEKGVGFLEAVYHECLLIELKRQQIPFVEKPLLFLSYKGERLNKYYTPDFLCYGNIIVEIKAVDRVTDKHRAQVINYLKSTCKPLGLLINFGHYPKIQHERFINMRP